MNTLFFGKGSNNTKLRKLEEKLGRARKGFSPSTIVRRAESQYELEHDERQEAARKHGRNVKGSNGHWLDSVREQYEADKRLPDGVTQ